MKVFFNHLAKCGGSTINWIAKEEFKQNFHELTPFTETSELNAWLSKETCFISSEMNGTTPENILTIAQSSCIKRIILSRDPIERFVSFCAHSTRDQQDKTIKGVSFWGHESMVKQPMSANDWLRCCITRMKCILEYKEDSIKLIGNDSDWTFSIYSQWMLGSFQSHYNFKTHNFKTYGTGNQRKHISRWRSLPNLPEQIVRFVEEFYCVTGTTDNIPLFIETLSKEGIFSSSRGLKGIATKNSTSDIRAQRKNDFLIQKDLIAEYYGLIPEDFWFNDACALLAQKKGDLNLNSNFNVLG